MIQYNNFLMKREQSRAGSRFAECEKSRLKAKILITLALLLTAVTGAWATDGVKLTTAELVPTAAWQNNYNDLALSDMPGLTADGITEDQAKAWADVPQTGKVDLIYGYVEHETYMDYKVIRFSDGKLLLSQTLEVSYEAVYYHLNSDNIKTYYATGVASAEAPITVEPVEGKTNEWTFSMPGSDVVLTPQYAPAAQLDENGKPAAVSGLEIAADAAIITAGQSAQGTLLYAVGTSETEKPALTDFAATLPNAKDQTAAGNYYVWYYIQGHDTPQGQEPSADNTFNDSEIMGPVIVELLTNEHTFNIKQSPNITVTVAGTAKTPTDDKVTPVTTGQEVKIKAKEGYKFRKVEVKKAEAATALAPALENGAVVVIKHSWEDGDTYFTFTNNGGTFSHNITGEDASHFANCSLTKNGNMLEFAASHDMVPGANLSIQFNTTDNTFYFKQKGMYYLSFTISVNGTDVTDQLSELK